VRYAVLVLILAAAAHCVHGPIQRCIATESETGKCADGLSGKILTYKHRKELLAALATKDTETSAFAVVRSTLPVVKSKTVRGSSAQDVSHELNSIDLKALAKKDFLVYLDLDDTLLEQWSPFYIEGYNALTIREDDVVDWHVALTPGLEDLLRTIRSLNGGIILYSRNDIRRVEALADLIPVAGSNLRHAVDGVLSGPYTIDAKLKDLNVVRHPNAIMLDDSPESVLPAQWGQVLDVEKFKPDIVNRDQGIIPASSPVHPSWIAGISGYDPSLTLSEEKTSVQQFMHHHHSKMDRIIQEIRTAHSRAKKENISFLEAIKPYSYAERRSGSAL
jgi:hypothetical protein